MLLAKSKWSTTDVLIFKYLLDSNITHDDNFSINNMLKEYDNMKEKIINTFVIY